MVVPGTPQPSEADASLLVRSLLHAAPLEVTRFRTGLAHYVYDVVLPDRRVVVRIAAGDRRSLDGAVYWSQRLRPLGVPLPALLGDDRAAAFTPFPALILERLPGTDLGHVYTTLSQRQKTALAAEIVGVQRRVGALPHGPGYGYAFSYEDQHLLPSWSGVIDRALARSSGRLRQNGYVDPAHVARVERLVPQFRRYFAGIPPQPFLDDTTTKNVLIAGGRLSGIVDVDVVCFGDPLLTVALTQMALLSKRADLVYTAAWCGMLALDAEQRAALQFYTCVFCLDFLSEIGAVANQLAPSADEGRIQHLLDLLDMLVQSVG